VRFVGTVSARTAYGPDVLPAAPLVRVNAAERAGFPGGDDLVRPVRCPGKANGAQRTSTLGGTMSGIDKLKNKAEELGGQGKEHAGKATGNEQLEAEGHADQASGNLKQAGEKVKDVFK
jgi:uncharacterized protein YjbJ (UPF0337 family)